MQRPINNIKLYAFITMLSLLAMYFGYRSFIHPIEHHSKYKYVSGYAYVIDGDSIKVNNTEIRLLGIDAPELLQSCGADNNTPCGKLAKQHLIDLIHHQTVKCYYKKFDRYHRVLGLCFAGKTALNKQMIKDGWAVSYYLFKKEEKLAKTNKLGIWKAPFEIPSHWRKEHHHDDHRAPANPQM